MRHNNTLRVRVLSLRILSGARSLKADSFSRALVDEKEWRNGGVEKWRRDAINLSELRSASFINL